MDQDISIKTAKDSDPLELVGFTASLGADGPPAEFQVFPYGQVELHGDVTFTVDEAAMDEVIRQFEARGIDLVVDYEHQTEGGEYSSPDGTAPAAGWIKQLINKGRDGLWAAVEWTDRARELLANREYRYYSPVFYVTENGSRLARLLRVALTNSPRLNRIRPLVAKQEGQNEETETMKEFLRLCAKLLGLPEDATQDQVEGAIREVKAKADRPSTPQGERGIVVAKEVLDVLGLSETAGQSEVTASILALKQTPDLRQEVATLKAKLAERDRDDLVAKAVLEGKITAAQREWAEAYALRDPDGFKIFVAKAPQVVPVDDLPAGKPADRQPSGTVSEGAMLIARMFGNTEEDLKKHI